MAKEILCKYCCTRFMPNEVHFRLVEPLAEEVEATVNEEEEDSIFGAVGRKKTSDKSNTSVKNYGLILDERLYEYYKAYVNYDETSARKDAMQLPYIAFDPMNSEIEYDYQEMNKYKYVMKVRYRRQELTTRLCPCCHMPLIEDAGKYDMYMFSVIGDTNVGKSIYLRVLEAMIEKGSFDAAMYFVGTKEEKEYYFKTRNEVINERKAIAATIGRVPALTFQLTYFNIAANTRNTVLITFCDIAGEKCRDHEELKIYGKHLKASSGLLFLIDPTRYSRVKNTLSEESRASIDHAYQLEVIAAINRFLVSGTHNTYSDIPTAIMITKSDTLKEVGYFQESDDRRKILSDPDWNNRHPKYLNVAEIKRIHHGVEGFLNAMGERDFTLKVSDLFSSYSYFISSSLGRSIAVNDNYDEVVKNSGINPYRITEALYWMMERNNLIPRKMKRVYKNSKSGEEKEVAIYYLAEDAQASVNNMIEAKKAAMGIKDNIFGGKWVLIREDHQ